MFNLMKKAVGVPLAWLLFLGTSPLWIPAKLLAKLFSLILLPLKLGARLFIKAINLWKPENKFLKFVKTSVIAITIFPVTPTAAAGIAWNEAGRPTEPKQIADIAVETFGIDVLYNWVSTPVLYAWYSLQNLV